MYVLKSEKHELARPPVMGEENTGLLLGNSRKPCWPVRQHSEGAKKSKKYGGGWGENSFLLQVLES